jgi:hypothetical protein
MRYSLVVGLIAVSAAIPLTVSAQQSWLCVADQGGGVRYDANARKWSSSTFRADQKFILNPYDQNNLPIGCLETDCSMFSYTVSDTESPRVNFPCKEIGDRKNQITCNEFYYQFRMNKETRRFVVYYPGNYMDAQENLQIPSGAYYRDSAAVFTGSCSIINTNASTGRSPNIRTVQQRLSDLGLYRGTIDGITGPGTRSAIQQFQRQNNLPATGDLDDRTMRLMFP